MKINFTKNEYRLLLEMITMADWVMQSRGTGEEFKENQNKYKKYNDLRNKILSYYREFDAGDMVSTSSEEGIYHETDQLLDHIHDNFMSVYDENSFWDELIHKLALRDILSEIGADKYEAMDMIERITKVEDAKTLYINEFDHNGLKNVNIGIGRLSKLSTEK